MLDRERVLFFLHKMTKLDRNSPEDRRKLIHYFLNSVYVYDDHLKIIVQFTEGSAIIPVESIPDPDPGSDPVTSGVLIGTHPNQIMFWYITRMA